MENNHEKLPEQNTDLMFGDDFDMDKAKLLLSKL